MAKSNIDRFTPLIQELEAFAFSQQGSMSILRSLGYGLLLLAFFDIVEMFVPPNFMNPAWEFQTFGALVERVPVPLKSRLCTRNPLPLAWCGFYFDLFFTLLKLKIADLYF
ncbi:MAG: HpsJ family protein [Spirirestis rafaelensis WJT71-NPBG6]|jgi:hypothetical protein|nr:HpsJ family protein [Spirirestis rafaelensis WJT71-NPBG6]